MSEQTEFAGIVNTTRLMSRRTFVKRASAFTVGVPVAASLLAACGGDSQESQAPDATATQGIIPTVGNVSASPPAAGTEAAGSTATGAMSAGSGGTPVKGGTLVVQGHTEVASLHPDDAQPWVHYVLVRNIHEPLVDLDYDYQLTPVLAVSYEAASDGMSYTFTLQTGVTFHDGQPFTAKDVKYNFDWYKNPQNAAVLGTDFAEIGEVETPDDETVVVNMTKVNAAFLPVAVTEMMIVSPAVHEQTGKDNYTPQAVGTGPYKLEEWKAVEQTTLVAFPEYWRGAPNIDTFREEVVPEGSVRAIALRSGTSDNPVWALQATDNLAFIQEDKFDVTRAAGKDLLFFPLNNDKPALSEKVVRQAMLTAIDRDRLVTDLERGLAVKATSNLTPAIVFYYNPDVKQYDYDPEAARTMLDEAGWVPGDDGIREKNGVRLAFTASLITGDQRRRATAEVVQQDLKLVGVDMQIEERPAAAITEGLPSGELESSLFDWTFGAAEPDARSTLRSDGTRNFSRYKNPQMDELLDQGVAIVDPAARQPIYKQVQEIVAEDVPFLYLMYYEDIRVWNRRVQGRPTEANNPIFVYAELYKFWIDDSMNSVT